MIGNPQNGISAVLDIYEFDLRGYPRQDKLFTTVNSSPHLITDKLTSTVMDDDCGLISTSYNPIFDIFQDTRGNIVPPPAKYNNDPDRSRSCDLFNGNIELVGVNAPRKNNLDSLPSNVRFNVSLPWGGIFRSSDLFNFMQVNGAKQLAPGNTDIIRNHLNYIYDPNFFNQLCANLQTEFRNDTTLIITPNTNTYIKVLRPSQYDKYIVFGDIHGSLQTLARNIFRFRAMNILDENFRLKENYNAIFLGDIVDRGNYGYECLVLIFLLKLINPRNVYINRGNHEELTASTAYGFRSEMIAKNFTINDFDTIIRTTIGLTHSALMIKDPHTNKYIWLCHGGVPVVPTNQFTQLGQMRYDLHNSVTNISNLNLGDQLVTDAILISGNPNNTNVIGHQIRWNDFFTNPTTNLSPRLPPGRGIGYQLGLDIIERLRQNNVAFVIRAHEDGDSNIKLYRPGNSLEPFSMHKLLARTHSRMACKGHFNSIYFEGDNMRMEKTDEPNAILLPVVVLSTNTDYGRNLNRDSFNILQFLQEGTRSIRRVNCRPEQQPINFPDYIDLLPSDPLLEARTKLLEAKKQTKNCVAVKVDYAEMTRNCNHTASINDYNITYNKLLSENNSRCDDYAASKRARCDTLRLPPVPVPMNGGGSYKHKAIKYQNKINHI
jgi:hypothetical protein